MVHGDGIKPSSGTQSKSFQTTGLDISDHIKHHNFIQKLMILHCFM